MDIFGDKWSLVVLRDILLFNKSHFREFLESKEKIATNILTDRLEKLVHAEMLNKEHDPDNHSAFIYKPTKKTLDLLPAYVQLMKWGAIYNPNTDKQSGPIMEVLLKDPTLVEEKVLQKFS